MRLLHGIAFSYLLECLLKDTLYRLVQAKNKMDAKNLALLIGPNLIPELKDKLAEEVCRCDSS